MQASKLVLILFAPIPVYAFAIPTRSLVEKPTNATVTSIDGQPWSKQDVLTLVGVCVAVVTVIIGLVGVLIASPKAREWLCRPIYWLTKRGLLGKHTVFSPTKAENRLTMIRSRAFPSCTAETSAFNHQGLEEEESQRSPSANAMPLR